MAEPGEFTLRALTNGKINLSQAEAISDLIAAQTNAAAKQASRQVGGELSKRWRSLSSGSSESLLFSSRRLSLSRMIYRQPR